LYFTSLLNQHLVLIFSKANRELQNFYHLFNTTLLKGESSSCMLYRTMCYIAAKFFYITWWGVGFIDRGTRLRPEHERDIRAVKNIDFIADLQFPRSKTQVTFLSDEELSVHNCCSDRFFKPRVEQVISVLGPSSNMPASPGANINPQLIYVPIFSSCSSERPAV
jgi:hypothetical protein